MPENEKQSSKRVTLPHDRRLPKCTRRLFRPISFEGIALRPPIRAPASRAHRASAPANVSPKKSSPMKDKHYLHRVAIVRLVDSLFYETGNARWSHSRCCSLITRIALRHRHEYAPAIICTSTGPELLAEVELPAALRELLRLYVLLIKKFPAARTADLLQALYRLMTIALEHSAPPGLRPRCADRMAAGSRPGTFHGELARPHTKNKPLAKGAYFVYLAAVTHRSCRRECFRAVRRGRPAS